MKEIVLPRKKQQRQHQPFQMTHIFICFEPHFFRTCSSSVFFVQIHVWRSSIYLTERKWQHDDNDDDNGHAMATNNNNQNNVNFYDFGIFFHAFRVHRWSHCSVNSITRIRMLVCVSVSKLYSLHSHARWCLSSSFLRLWLSQGVNLIFIIMVKQQDNRKRNERGKRTRWENGWVRC